MWLSHNCYISNTALPRSHNIPPTFTFNMASGVVVRCSSDGMITSNSRTMREWSKWSVCRSGVHGTLPRLLPDLRLRYSSSTSVSVVSVTSMWTLCSSRLSMEVSRSKLPLKAQQVLLNKLKNKWVCQKLTWLLEKYKHIQNQPTSFHQLFKYFLLQMLIKEIFIWRAEPGLTPSTGCSS